MSEKRYFRKSLAVPLVVKIEKVLKESENVLHRRDAQSYLDYYVRNGFLTNAMKSRGKELVELTFGKPEKTAKPGKAWGKHYLYAITDGEALKIGFSKSPKRRIKAIKTGNKGHLKLVWVRLCAFNSRDAFHEERRLHKRLRDLRINREWFSMDALAVCEAWRVRNLASSQKSYLKYLSYGFI